MWGGGEGVLPTGSPKGFPYKIPLKEWWWGLEYVCSKAYVSYHCSLYFDPLPTPPSPPPIHLPHSECGKCMAGVCPPLQTSLEDPSRTPTPTHPSSKLHMKYVGIAGKYPQTSPPFYPQPPYSPQPITECCMMYAGMFGARPPLHTNLGAPPFPPGPTHTHRTCVA